MPKNKILTIIFFLGIGTILLFSIDAIRGNGPLWQILQLRDVDGNPFQSSLTRGRLALVESIVQDKSLVIDKYASGTFPDVSYARGHYYSVFDPGVTFLAVPFYALGSRYNLGILFTFLLSPILIILTAYLIYRTLRLLSFRQSTSLLTTFIIIFGTSIYPYTGILNAHPLSAFVISLALFGATQAVIRKRYFIGNSIFWLAFGLSIITDYANGISLVPIGIVLFLQSFSNTVKEGKRMFSINLAFFFTIVLSLIGLIPLLVYTKTIYGTYVTTIETHQVQGYVNDYGKNVYTLVNNPQFYLTHQALHNPLKLDPHFSFNGIYTILFSPQRGLFFYSPILLLAFFGIREAIKKNKYLAYGSLYALLITVLTYGSYSDYYGGWSFGTRFLIGVMPVTAIFIASSIERYLVKNILFTIFFVLLGSTSIIISIIGAFTSRVIPSSLEKEFLNCTLQCSFIREIPLIQNGKYLSFIYSEYLQRIVTRETYIGIIAGVLLIMFVLLILFYSRQRSAKRSITT